MAKAIAERRGLGQLRHVATRFLWVQQRVANRDLDVVKVPGKENESDLLTKHLDEKECVKFMTKMGFEYRQGRACGAVQLKGGLGQ